VRRGLTADRTRAHDSARLRRKGHSGEAPRLGVGSNPCRGCSTLPGGAISPGQHLAASHSVRLMMPRTGQSANASRTHVGSSARHEHERRPVRQVGFQVRSARAR
jgi:hypothetical protein